MHNDEIDDMLSRAVPTAHPGRWCGLESSRSVIGHIEDSRGDSFLQRCDWTQRDDPGRPGEKLPQDVARESVSKTNGVLLAEAESQSRRAQP